MPTDVLMPKLSDTMEEGRIIKWLKQPGDAVKSGDVLAEVETDKANMEIEAFDDGVLRELTVPEGESAAVGAVIAVLGDAGDAKAAGSAPKAAGSPAPKAGSAPAAKAAAPNAGRSEDRARETGATDGAESGEEVVAEAEPRAPQQKGPAKVAPPEAKPAARRDEPAPARSAPRPTTGDTPGVKASPLARKIAAERGIDLARVQGTGPGGRIVEKDLDAAAARGSAPGAGPTETPPTPSTPRPAATPPPARPAPAAAGAGRREFSRMRKTTAKRMADAKRDVPHFYVSGDLAMDELVRLREGLAALAGEFEGITITHLLVKACGLALRRVPEMNASFDVDGIVVHERVNVGIAAATDDGLLVPVVRDVDHAPLAEVVRNARAVVGRARAGKPAGDDLSGGTFTVSNLGMFPVSHFAAVVNPPQAAILSVGTIREVPVVRDGAIVPGRQMTVTLSCDHRVVDGALAGRFLAELKALVEQPLTLLV